VTRSLDGSTGTAEARRYAPLTLAIAAAFLARAVAGGSAESVRAELWLTDQALGTLASAFAGAYAVALPAGAHLARRGRRRRLLGAGLGLCGIATAASALANGFFSLVFGRSAAGVGAGLAAGAAGALLAGAERRQRGTGSGLLAPAVVGIAAGYLAGGLCGRMPGWRLAFVLAGVALAAAGVLLHLRAGEPAGGGADVTEAFRRDGLRAALRSLRDRARALGLAAAILGAAGLSALGFWLPGILGRLQATPMNLAGAQLAAALVAASIAGAALARAGLRALPPEGAPRWLASAGAGAAALALAVALAWSAPLLVLGALMVGLTAAMVAVYGALAVPAGGGGPEPATLALAVLLVHGVGELSGPMVLGAVADRASLGRALVLLPASLFGSAVLWAASAWVARGRTDDLPAQASS
jgi:predicted MFS family arabinose efflux permease